MKSEKEGLTKGLYFNCNEKYKVGHKCQPLFLIDCCEEEEAKDSESSSDEAEEEPEISLRAVKGGITSSTMRVIGKIEGQEVIVLLDTGSAHNFLSQAVIDKLKVLVDRSKTVRVKVASREKHECTRRLQVFANRFTRI